MTVNDVTMCIESIGDFRIRFSIPAQIATIRGKQTNTDDLEKGFDLVIFLSTKTTRPKIDQGNQSQLRVAENHSIVEKFEVSDFFKSR